MKYIKYILLSVFMLVFLTTCKPQAPKSKVKFETTDKTEVKKKVDDPFFTESDEIETVYGPKSITRNIMQDRNGDFWFATWQGIFHYDGVRFTNCTNKYGLKRHRVFCMLEDAEGVLWFGTIGAGVYRYDGESFEHITTKDGLLNNSIICIYEDFSGNLWFGTGAGLSKYDGANFQNYTKKDGLLDTDINAIAQDESGVFWIGTRGRAWTYNGMFFSKLVNIEGQTFQNVRTIIKDQENNMLLGGNDGIWLFSNAKFDLLSTDFAGYLYQDSARNIWASQSDAGFDYQMSLNKYQMNKAPVQDLNREKVFTPEGQVFGILEDDQGRLWFGTESGVCRKDGLNIDCFQK